MVKTQYLGVPNLTNKFKTNLKSVLPVITTLISSIDPTKIQTSRTWYGWYADNCNYVYDCSAAVYNDPETFYRVGAFVCVGLGIVCVGGIIAQNGGIEKFWNNVWYGQGGNSNGLICENMPGNGSLPIVENIAVVKDIPTPFSTQKFLEQFDALTRSIPADAHITLGEDRLNALFANVDISGSGWFICSSDLCISKPVEFIQNSINVGIISDSSTADLFALCFNAAQTFCVVVGKTGWGGM